MKKLLLLLKIKIWVLIGLRLRLRLNLGIGIRGWDHRPCSSGRRVMFHCSILTPSLQFDPSFKCSPRSLNNRDS
ncbi:hypothetical protein MtrunA17_Chr8g0342391 [Medicago truncatula]|uniref:Transmembrane protein n=1 Tax=Medicago truncatula TaxID=3880 RepID=A0A396GKW9_MEDTR|nr:hypothetical protein MtrunA17_Chr8g0342391 [Medicago truncatula]